MTTQKNISAGGHVAGRDIVIHPQSKTSAILKNLFEQYKADVETKAKTDQIVENLQAYMDSADDPENPRDLQNKLTDAGKAEIIKEAQRFKELFRRRVERFQHFPAAQEIYAFLLGQALTRFTIYVQPAISSGKSVAEIKALINKEVIEPIIDSIPNSEPTCDHPAIYGMIFFLTGNCFVEWQ
jgi:hypothetical protein